MQGGAVLGKVRLGGEGGHVQGMGWGQSGCRDSPAHLEESLQGTHPAPSTTADGRAWGQRQGFTT